MSRVLLTMLALVAPLAGVLGGSSLIANSLSAFPTRLPPDCLRIGCKGDSTPSYWVHHSNSSCPDGRIAITQYIQGQDGSCSCDPGCVETNGNCQQDVDVTISTQPTYQPPDCVTDGTTSYAPTGGAWTFNASASGCGDVPFYYIKVYCSSAACPPAAGANPDWTICVRAFCWSCTQDC